MYPTEPARELSQYFVSDPELIPKIKTALRKVNGGPQDPSLNPPYGQTPGLAHPDIINIISD